MRAIQSLMCGTLIILACIFPAKTIHAQTQPSVTFQVFYDNLSPYGQWIEDPGLGYVWAPSAGAGFRPYFSNGHWVMTEFGSTWVSDYPWGWAPFHYGRWIHDSFYGWVWAPGTEWGPAWVVWRSGGDYYGWAPITPGIRVTAALGPSYYTPNDWWVFIPRTNLLSPIFLKFSKGSNNNATIMRSSSVLGTTGVNNGVTYVTGPKADDFARATNSHVPIYNLKNASKPGKAILTKNEASLYMPAVTTYASGIKPTPAKSNHSVHAIGKASAISEGSGSTQQATSGKKAKTTKKQTGTKTSSKSQKPKTTTSQK